MTGRRFHELPTGDKGQRYEVRTTGYPKAEESVLGWASKKEGAEEMARAIRQAPGFTSARIVDREGKEPDFTIYGGVLR